MNLFGRCRHWTVNELTGPYSIDQAGLVLNHKAGGITASHYVTGVPLAQKLEMLERWEEHVKSLIQPDENVVLLA